MSKLIKTVEIPEYVSIIIPPYPDFIEIYNDHISFEGKRNLYYENYTKPCFISMDDYGPIAKIKFFKRNVMFDYEIHIFSKPAKRREEARKFAFDLYTAIQREFDKKKTTYWNIDFLSTR